MNGYDCAHPFQKDINTARVPADFVIVKVGQGYHYVNPQWKQMIDRALSAGKLGGLYYYGEGHDAKREADHFAELVRPYIGKVILAYDWEGTSNVLYRKKGGEAFVEAFMRRVYELTKVRPFLYINQGEAVRGNWAKVAKISPLWLAQYKSGKVQAGYITPTGWGPLKHWKAPEIWQYSSKGRLPGFCGNLDLDICYMTDAEWKAHALPESSGTELVVVNGVCMPILKKGMRESKAVEIWQGIIGVDTDGYFGPQTLDATLAYQRAHKNCGNPDGIVAKKSWTTGLEMSRTGAGGKA